MGFFNRRQQTPQRRPRRSLLFFLILVVAVLKLLGSPVQKPFDHQKPFPGLPPPPVFYPPDVETDWLPPAQNYQFNGYRVGGNGTFLDLGDRRTHLPESLLIRFFPEELVVASCLTQPPPPTPPSNQPVNKPLPIREDWPGFFGAPWIARSNGNLFALLHVYAPRNAALPVAAPQFQIYPSYSGQQTTPAFSAWEQAIFLRGSKAVLYRVFMDGPVRCLDLVVKNGDNSGTGHLYYLKHHHYYEMDTTFQIQP